MKKNFERFPHAQAINWYDLEFKKHMNIDIYDYNYDFNKKLGYSVLNVDNNIKILCMKVEIENTEKKCLKFISK